MKKAVFFISLFFLLIENVQAIESKLICDKTLIENSNVLLGEKIYDFIRVIVPSIIIIILLKKIIKNFKFEKRLKSPKKIVILVFEIFLGIILSLTIAFGKKIIILLDEKFDNKYFACINCLITGGKNYDAFVYSENYQPGYEYSMQKLDSSNRQYTKTLYVGDSRTLGMCNDDGCENNEYIANVSLDYYEFALNTISEIDKVLELNQNNNYNIVLGIGINSVFKDGANQEMLFSKYEELAKGKWKNHHLVILSLNPVLDGRNNAYMSGVNIFNKNMKEDIKNSNLKNITYCDTSNGVGYFLTSDGLHYYDTTNVKIYNYIESNCLK